jgi:hypothetical protein
LKELSIPSVREYHHFLHFLFITNKLNHSVYVGSFSYDR